MGIALPQLAPASEDRVSGAQVIDGCLKFNGLEYLTRTPGSAGNRKTWTWSAWVKRDLFGERHNVFGAQGGDNNGNCYIEFRSTDRFQLEEYNDSGLDFIRTLDQVTRDTGWIHWVVVYDSTQSVDNDKQKIYKNGVLQTDTSALTHPSLNEESAINNNTEHRIGIFPKDGVADAQLDGRLTQVYLIDGLALGPGFFGFTDTLTNTWRPKKFRAEGTTVNNGTVWSSSVAPGSAFRSGYPAVDAFNGTTKTSTNDCAAPNNVQDAFIEFTFGGGVSFTTLQMQLDDNNEGTVLANGVDITSQLSTGSLDNTTITGINSPLRSLRLTKTTSGSSTLYLGSITIDGVMMVDSTTTNLDFGTNGFYLPLDGNSPIGQDQSGKENHWLTQHFGSTTLDKATGAKPILNTIHGGIHAAVGVFGSKENATYTATGSSGSGSGYVFDGISGNNPSFSFIRGATYTFDYSSASGHPLRFSSTDPDSSTTAYTTGTNTDTSNVIKFTVPHDAPDNLWYYCTNHSNMNGAITVRTDETKVDKYASNLVAALPLVNNADDVSNSINCTSTTKSVTTVGDAHSSIDHFNFYRRSFEFDGTDDRLTLDIGAGGLGSGDYTVECWVWARVKGGDRGPFAIVETSGGLQNGGDGRVDVYGDSSQFWRSMVDSNLISSTAVLDSERWNHLAVVRSGNTQTLYVNGTKHGDHSISVDMSATRYVCVGGRRSTSYLWNGYIQDFRIYSGVAKYTSDFLVPETSPDILPDTPSGVSYKSKLAKIIDGAVSFDGSGDYLSVGNSSDFVVGTGDFTMECYIYQKSQGSEATVFGLKHTGGSGWTGYKFYINTSGGFVFYAEDAGSGDWDIILSAGNGTVSLNRWHHLSATRNGNTFRVFVDGVEKASTTSSVDLNDGGDGFYISQNGGNQQYFNGFISNVRVIKGTALYTSSFTPPIRALTNVTNTKLLCCQSNTSVTTAAVTPGTITANGDAAATNFNPFNTDINTVRGQETGYPTIDPLNNIKPLILTDGNLRIKGNGSSWNTALCTGVMESGKWYIEFTHIGRHSISDNDIQLGLFGLNDPENAYPLAEGNDLAQQSTAYVIVDGQAKVYHNGTDTSYGVSWATIGTIVGIRFNADTGKLGFIINGIDQGDIPYTLSSSQRWVVGISMRGDGATGEINFGQKPFKFPPPDGFQTLNLANVRTETVITRPDQYVGIVTYSGDNSEYRLLSLNHQPDFTWFKERGNTRSHILSDTVTGITKHLSTDGTGAQTSPSYPYVSSVDERGIVLRGGTSSGGNVSGRYYVAWTWKAGGNKGTFNKDGIAYASAAAAGLDGGSATPTGSSVGTKQGFSIIAASGSNTASKTFSHGLSQAPDFALIKLLADAPSNGIAQNWQVYHQSLGNTKGMQIDTTNSVETSSSLWNNTSPTDTLFTIGASTRYEGAFISYIWHDVPGLQKFGSFIGNADSGGNGPFVELGFRPALVWFKPTTGTQPWNLFDSERGKINPIDEGLLINTDGAEFTGTARVDYLSNGFKVRAPSGANPNVATTYIYCAWAEVPEINLFGAQSNAR